MTKTTILIASIFLVIVSHGDKYQDISGCWQVNDNLMMISRFFTFTLNASGNGVLDDVFDTTGTHVTNLSSNNTAIQFDLAGIELFVFQIMNTQMMHATMTKLATGMSSATNANHVGLVGDPMCMQVTSWSTTQTTSKPMPQPKTMMTPTTATTSVEATLSSQTTTMTTSSNSPFSTSDPVISIITTSQISEPLTTLYSSSTSTSDRLSSSPLTTPLSTSMITTTTGIAALSSRLTSSSSLSSSSPATRISSTSNSTTSTLTIQSSLGSSLATTDTSVSSMSNAATSTTTTTITTVTLTNILPPTNVLTNNDKSTLTIILLCISQIILVACFVSILVGLVRRCNRRSRDAKQADAEFASARPDSISEETPYYSVNAIEEERRGKLALARQDSIYDLLPGTIESMDTELRRTTTPRTLYDIVAPPPDAIYDEVVDIHVPGTGTFIAGVATVSSTSQLPHVRLTAQVNQDYMLVPPPINMLTE